MVKKGEYNKAENFLDKASRANYGFCGNAWASAEGEIKNTKAEIYILLKNYDKALLVLETVDGCGFDADCATREILKITALINKFGKIKVQNAFNTATNFTIPDQFSYQYSVVLPSLNYTFTFENYVKTDKNIPQTNDVIRALIKEQKFYSLLE